MVAQPQTGQKKRARLSPQAYLEQERNAATKSEYRDGEIVAMAGASKAHNRITFNLSGLLYTQLKDTSCEGFSNDLRVRVTDCNRYYYPDVVVVCGEPRFEDAEEDTLLNPALLIEVLSDSTEKTDRGEKFLCYQTLDSLSTYVLIAQDEPRAEYFVRQSDGTWQYASASPQMMLCNLL